LVTLAPSTLWRMDEEPRSKEARDVPAAGLEMRASAHCRSEFIPTILLVGSKADLQGCRKCWASREHCPADLQGCRKCWASREHWTADVQGCRRWWARREHCPADLQGCRKCWASREHCPADLQGCRKCWASREGPRDRAPAWALLSEMRQR